MALAGDQGGGVPAVVAAAAPLDPAIAAAIAARGVVVSAPAAPPYSPPPAQGPLDPAIAAAIAARGGGGAGGGTVVPTGPTIDIPVDRPAAPPFSGFVQPQLGAPFALAPGLEVSATQHVLDVQGGPAPLAVGSGTPTILLPGSAARVAGAHAIYTSSAPVRQLAPSSHGGSLGGIARVLERAGLVGHLPRKVRRPS